MKTMLYDQWVEEGYVVVRHLFDLQRTERLRTICEHVLTQWRIKNPETGEPGGGPDATVMRHLNHSGYFRDGKVGLKELLEAVADDDVLEVCRVILGEEPLFRCTSLFMNPLENSRDGNWHRDTQFLYPDVEEEKGAVTYGGDAGNSIQLQVALVPSDDVEVVPGSHRRWDTPEEFQIRRADSGRHSQSNAVPGALRVALEAGDAVAFNPYGLHRGRYHTDRLRRTLMLTYTRVSKVLYDYFSHQPWFLEPGYLEGLRPTTRAFFETFMVTYEGKWVKKQEKGKG